MFNLQKLPQVAKMYRVGQKNAGYGLTFNMIVMYLSEVNFYYFTGHNYSCNVDAI